jgi:predicted SAM-dependent methyltransferase
MRLYLGSSDYKPEGFATVDIDPAMQPDIVADIVNLSPVADESCDEIVAGHVLEHVEWPDGFLALSEFARVLKRGGLVKIAVPDLGLLARMLLNGDSAFHATGLIFGIRGRTHPFEKHRYGYTAGMLVDVLESLGFADFRWWNSEIHDASNGWCYGPDGRRIAVSLNISAVKKGGPAIPLRELYNALKDNPLADFAGIASHLRASPDAAATNADAKCTVPKLYQHIHFQLIEARQRIRYLEQQLAHPSHET